jgi:hypothetical protein
MAKSTISTVLKNREAIKVAKGVKSLTNKRLPAVEEVEKLLMVWLNEKQLASDSVSEAICEEARLLYSDITRDTPGSSAEEFKAGKGQSDNFKKRTGIHSVVRHREAASSNKDAAENFVEKFKDFVELQDLHKEQQQEVAEELSSEEDKNNEGSITTAEIKELLGCWSKTQNLVEKWHPNVAIVNRCINLFDDNVMKHFRKILKSWQR